MNNRYSIELPKFLNKTNNLNDDASLQYQHIWKELYVIVIDELKREFSDMLNSYSLNSTYSNNVDSYFSLVETSIKELGRDYVKHSTIDTRINNLPAIITSFDINIDGDDTSWILGVFEGHNTYYQLVICTSNDKRLKYHDLSKKIINSFKEI